MTIPQDTEHRPIPATGLQDEAAARLASIADFVRQFREPWGSWKTAWWESEVSDDVAFTADNALMHVHNLAVRPLAFARPTEQHSPSCRLHLPTCAIATGGVCNCGSVQQADAIPVGMKPWHGGDSAPDDWDGGPVLGEDGALYDPPIEWQKPSGGPDVVAYTPRMAHVDPIVSAYTPKAPTAESAGPDREAVAEALWGVNNADRYGLTWEQAKASGHNWVAGCYQHADAITPLLSPQEREAGK
jgi:hypothetical protein